ncbi:MAG: RHS repeat-associated core domain-containing protein [Sphingobacteriales bacterium]|nr:MAG: RHS repeat-associated core domain-containing protein [Sphingobacteriales bacterium]
MCTKTTSAGAQPQYGCPNGGTVSGGYCVGGGAATTSTYIYLGGKQIAEVNNGVTQYVHTDALGSPVAHTSAAGALLNRTRYEAYGYPFAGTKPSVNTSVIGFTGHQQDAETDLVYMQQRYYDPLAGRFLSVDPLVTDANTGKGFGLYTYVENNPYAKVDPDGRIAIVAAIPSIVQAIGAAAASNTGAAVAGVATGAAIGAALSSSNSSGDSRKNSNTTTTSAAGEAVQRKDAFVVRVQAQGTSLKNETSMPIVGSAPIPADKVQAALQATAAGLTPKEQARMAAAFAAASAWTNKVAEGGGIGPIGSTTFNVPGMKGSQARVDVEILKGHNIVP